MCKSPVGCVVSIAMVSLQVSWVSTWKAARPQCEDGARRGDDYTQQAERQPDQRFWLRRTHPVPWWGRGGGRGGRVHQQYDKNIFIRIRRLKLHKRGKKSTNTQQSVNMSWKSDPVFINDNITTTVLIVKQTIVSYNDCFIVITTIIMKDSSLFLKGGSYWWVSSSHCGSWLRSQCY